MEGGGQNYHNILKFKDGGGGSAWQPSMDQFQV